MPGVYIAYPFCAQKCTFCNFESGVFPLEMQRRYLEALEAEIRAHRWEWKPETVYLGGGTPGNLDPDALRRILEPVPGRPWAEATVEAAPGGITAETARAWAACRINRVSLGAQSFVEKEIRRTGRKHTAQAVADDVRTLREAGIQNFNIDLIAGLSGQTEQSWAESLDCVERLAPPHVSVYMLEVDAASRLGAQILLGGSRYGASEAPDDDRVAALYETAVQRLAAMGIPRYEISNFARPGFESRHNMKYWKLEPYVGFGSDAHSFDGRFRRGNAETPADYLEQRAGLVAGPPATEANIEEERFFVGLRLMAGVRPTPLEWERFAEPIRGLVDVGLLERRDGALRLTHRGVPLSNEVFREFIEL